MFQAVSTVVVLFLFWLLLSGFFTAFLLTAGAASALAVVLFVRRMNLLPSGSMPMRDVPRVLLYAIWLMKEIVRSAWGVSKIILHPALPISPTLVEFVPTQRSTLGLVMHANSITLTPATITIDAQPGRFCVHGLTRDSANGVVDSEMDARISACEARD